MIFWELLWCCNIFKAILKSHCCNNFSFPCFILSFPFCCNQPMHPSPLKATNWRGSGTQCFLCKFYPFFKFKIIGFIVNVWLLFKMVCTHFFLVCLDTFFKCLVFSCAQLEQNNWHCSRKRCLIINSFLSIVFEILFQSFCGISAASNWHGTRLE